MTKKKKKNAGTWLFDLSKRHKIPMLSTLISLFRDRSVTSADSWPNYRILLVRYIVTRPRRCRKPTLTRYIRKKNAWPKTIKNDRTKVDNPNYGNIPKNKILTYKNATIFFKRLTTLVKLSASTNQKMKTSLGSMWDEISIRLSKIVKNRKFQQQNAINKLHRSR